MDGQKAPSRTERQQAIEEAIRSFNPDADEAEELLLVLQAKLQGNHDRRDYFGDVDRALDAARDALTAFHDKLAKDQPEDEMDLSRADRQRRDDEAAEVES